MHFLPIGGLLPYQEGTTRSMSHFPPAILAGTLLLALTPAQPPAEAADPGAQHRRTLPPVPTPSWAEDARRELRNRFRLLRRSEGEGRFRVRRQLMDRVHEWAPLLEEVLVGSANHDEQVPVLLALMEVQETALLPTLARLAAGRISGSSGVAGLALGKSGDPGMLEPLEELARKDSHRRRRLMGLLAIGRLGAPGGLEVVRAQLRRASSGLERRGALLSLAMGGWPGAFPEILRFADRSGEGRRDAERRAAALALGFSRAKEATGPLLKLLADEDPTVRAIAAEGLAYRRSPLGDESVKAIAGRLRSEQDPEVLARLVLLAVPLPEIRPVALKRALAGEARPKVRAAAAAAALHLERDTGRRLVQVCLASGHAGPTTRLNAVLASVALEAGANAPASLVPWINDRDQEVRRAALLGEVYLRGRGALKVLQDLQGSEVPDDVRELARELAGDLEGDVQALRRLCRARLQVLLDASQGAASWNLHHSHARLLYLLLDLDNALPRGGGGAAPTVGAGVRSKAAAALRPPPLLEDLRRHFDAWPYMDVRAWLELPPPP